MTLPSCPFYLFGMGGRPKRLYRRGELLDALTGEAVRRWSVADERIVPHEYRVELRTADGRTVAIREDEEGLWLDEQGETTALAQSRVSLPSFGGHPHHRLLRALHQELLVNIVPAGPVPNLLVYRKPWYRDGAMVCMCLEKTGNLHLAERWINGLDEPYDRNNGGECEPDNLGQALYLISLVSDASHPLVPALLAAAAAVTEDRHLVGLTDGAQHPVYQTKWLKLGLRRLGLEDRYEVPEVFDSYSALFWMEYRDAHVEGPRFPARAGELYPYLRWAEAHFHREPPPMELTGEGYPLTWEAQAGQADYSGMRPVCEEYEARKICAPHTWHAAEMFLYLLELS
jgi:hypothetical protein